MAEADSTSRGEALRYVYYTTLGEAIRGVRAAEYLNFAYKLERFDVKVEDDDSDDNSGDETGMLTAQWRLTIYDYWEVDDATEPSLDEPSGRD